MSTGEFRRAVSQSWLHKGDKEWFPKWFEQYARFVNCRQSATVRVESELVIEFSRSLLKSGKTAWARLQAVRAIEFYRDRVLDASEPALNDVLEKLAEIAEKERRQSKTPVSEELPPSRARGSIVARPSRYLARNTLLGGDRR